jgi:hypothetical protein
MPSRGGPGAQFGLGGQGKHVLVQIHRHRSKEGREASLEVSDVSREFPRVTVLKFSMSDRQDDTLCYKVDVACLAGWVLWRVCGIWPRHPRPPRLRGVQNGISEITLPDTTSPTRRPTADIASATHGNTTVPVSTSTQPPASALRRSVPGSSAARRDFDC